MLSSCSKNDNGVTPVATTLASSQVPSLVLASMSRNYPQAAQTTWVQTAPTAFMATFKQTSTARTATTATFQATGAVSRVGTVIDPATLPTAITDYLKANYAGYTVVQAEVKKDAAGTITGYETLITVGTTQYELEFNAAGVFAKLETADGHAEGNGIAQASLLPAITTYLNATYAGYTFHEAETKMTNGAITGYKVEIVQNGTKYNVLFDAAGKFVSVNAGGQGGEHDGGKGGPDNNGTDTAIAQKDVPAAAATYLDSNYKGYVFVGAFVDKDSAGTITGYDVKFTLAGKSYEAEFDAAGKFVQIH